MGPEDEGRGLADWWDMVGQWLTVRQSECSHRNLSH